MDCTPTANLLNRLAELDRNAPTLSSLQANLTAAMQAQAVAWLAADGAEARAEALSGRAREIALEEQTEQTARAQEAGLMARELGYQLEAYRDGFDRGAAGYQADYERTDVRAGGKDAKPYFAGYKAGLRQAGLL